jgi:fructose-1,6-bisphosphatase/sedoheptulose 1,7-bisphosphatase-like protein
MILLVFVIVFSSAFGDVLSVSSKEVVSDTPKLYLKGLTVNPLEKNIDIPIQLMKESYKTNETGPG